MSTDTDYGKSDKFTQNLIRKKARQLVGKYGFTEADQDDNRQELRLRLIQRWKSFDSSKGHWNVFVVTVVERSVASLVRYQTAEKRDYRRTCSLSTVIGEDEDGPVELGDIIGQRAHDSRLGRAIRSETELVEIKSDVAGVVATLSPELRGLAEALKTDSISEIARS
jgi:hypothetical protein